MNVKRIAFFGVRTPEVAETAAFFRDVLGLRHGRGSANWMTQTLPSGPWDMVEVFGADFDDERLFPSNGQQMVIGFMVDDLEGARAEVEATGAELLGETVWADETFGNPAYAGVGWFFLRAPDGNVYVIQQSD